MNWKEQLREDLADNFVIYNIDEVAQKEILFTVGQVINVDVIQKLIDEIPDETSLVDTNEFNNYHLVDTKTLKQDLRARWLQ
jgi:GTPase Era involved in 16S rRNA processing